ncbi:hypothetical protein GCM10022420_001210 [Streptomyces iranensis]
MAEQIGELPCPVGTEPPAARGGDRRGVLAGAFGWHRPAPGVCWSAGSYRDHTDGAGPMVLPKYCAT